MNKFFGSLLIVIIFLISVIGNQSGIGSAVAAGPQKVCPVLGNPIDKKIYVDYKGERIYFCCSVCPPEFNKDPEKFIKKMKKDGVDLEKVPISKKK